MITQPFGPGLRSFVLKTRGWREVEKTCGAGLAEIAARLAPLVRLLSTDIKAYPGGIVAAIAAGHLGSSRIDDVREPVLQGLIDGGMTITEAGALVHHVFEDAIAKGKSPLLLFGHLAFTILTAALIGLGDEIQPGEPKAAAPKARRRSPTARRASSKSTQPSA